jgi:hypothetical protein
MRGHARLARVAGAGEFGERIAGALRIRQARIEQPFTQAIGGDHYVLDAGGLD